MLPIYSVIAPPASEIWYLETSPSVEMHLSFLHVLCLVMLNVLLILFHLLPFSYVFVFPPINVSSYDQIPRRRRRCVLLHGRHGHVSQLVLPPSAGRSAHSRLGFVAHQQLLCLPRRVSLWKCSSRSSCEHEHEFRRIVFAFVLGVTRSYIKRCHLFGRVADYPRLGCDRLSNIFWQQIKNLNH